MSSPITASILVSADGTNITYNGQTYWVPGNTFSTNSDGSLSFNGTVWWPAATDTASGTGIVVFGPGGARASFAGMIPGPPGPAPQLTWQFVPVAYGDPLPTPNPVATPTEWDSYGNPVAINMTLYVWSGAPGSDGTMVIPNTLDGATAQAGYQIGYNATDATAQWQPKLVGGWYYASGITASASNTTTQKFIGSILMPSFPFAYWPVARAQMSVIGATDTRVDLVARIGGPTGQIFGRGYGIAGAAPPVVHIEPYQLGPGSATIIAAGTGTTLFLYAENQTTSPNAWSTTASCSFSAKVDPVPS